jgi:hypothetical protein
MRKKEEEEVKIPFTQAFFVGNKAKEDESLQF